MPKRTVFNMNAFTYLSKHRNIKCIITSLPDPEEIKIPPGNWEGWLKTMLNDLEKSLDKDGVIIFYQTDRRDKGTILDKAYLIKEHFYSYDYNLVFQKIVLKMDVGKISLFRPSYTNLFGFSKSKKITTGKPTPDVIEAGDMFYKNAMGLNACQTAINFVRPYTTTIVDPFCGQGSILKVANDNGLDSIGIDIDKKQCTKARKL
jgi:hypothetical protein